MTRSRLNLSVRWQMIAIAVMAMFLAASIEVAPDVRRRWLGCRKQAEQLEADLRWWSTQPIDPKLPAEKRRSMEAYTRRTEDGLRSKIRMYRRALYIPWEFYSLGSDLRP